MITLTQWMRQRSGVAHTADIYAAGYGRHAIEVLVELGELIRVRRSWLLLPDAATSRFRAASAGGRLTCVSAAKELGLWTPAHADTHVAVPPSASRIDASGLKLHWATGPAPVAKHAPMDPLLNALFHVARCLTPTMALSVWESALNMRLISAEVLQGVKWHATAPRRLAEMASLLSDSGLETFFVQLMRDIGVAVMQQVRIDGHLVDALVGTRLVVQLDGFAHHSTAEDRRRDILADARLHLRGYTVLRFDYHQILFQPELVQDIVRAAIAQGRHLAA